MRLEHIQIHNYKSLRDVRLELRGFTTLVGPNGSGKSNLCDALHFLAETYRHGLEVAVARKGGFENIAHKKQRRTKGAIQFTVRVSVSEPHTRRWGDRLLARHPAAPARLSITHSFSVAARGRAIDADFGIKEERLSIEYSGKSATRNTQFDIHRATLVDDLERLTGKGSEYPMVLDRLFGSSKAAKAFAAEFVAAAPQTLMATVFPLRELARPLLAACGGIGVLQLNPDRCRVGGTPSPNPEISRFGENLPAIVHWLQHKHPDIWQDIASEMRSVLPDLDSISVPILSNKTLGLNFVENNGRTWGMDEVSDGTIHTLSMLVASSDPRNNILVVEEPENSVHPWVLRILVEHFRKLSLSKTVLMTTHSPFAVDMMSPTEIVVVSKRNSETHVDRLVDLCPGIESDWEEGEVRISEYLDAGLVPKAVPGVAT